MDFNWKLPERNESINYYKSRNKINTGDVIYPNFKFIRLSETERIIFFIIYLVVFSLSMIGNIATLFTTHERKIRLLQKFLIISLALSDMVVCISFGINNMINFSHAMSNWVLGEFMCHFVPYIQHFGPVANSLTMVCIAFDRYKSIVHPLNKQWNPNIWMCILLFVGIWGFSAAIAFPIFLLYAYTPIKVLIVDPITMQALSTEIMNLYMCTLIHRPLHQIFYTSIFTIIFLPLFLIFFWLYYKIAKLIWKRRKPFKSKVSELNTSITLETSTDSGKTSSTNNKLSPVISQINREVKSKIRSNKINTAKKIRTFKIILIIMLVFFVCRLPHYLLNLIRYSVVLSNHQDWIIANAFSFLLILNTMLNPFLYSFLSQTMIYFDKFFYSIGDFISNICCCCCSNNEFDDFEKDNPFLPENYNPRHSQTSSIIAKGFIKDQKQNKVKFIGTATVNVYPKEFSSSVKYLNCQTF